jgi:hypothetical protein
LILSPFLAGLSHLGVPTKQDMDRLVHAGQAAARECGHRVIYISRVPAHQPASSAEVRRYISHQLVPTLAESILASHIVLEGEGFAAALKRAAGLAGHELRRALGRE